MFTLLVFVLILVPQLEPSLASKHSWRSRGESEAAIIFHSCLSVSACVCLAWTQ